MDSNGQYGNPLFNTGFVNSLIIHDVYLTPILRNTELIFNYLYRYNAKTCPQMRSVYPHLPPSPMTTITLTVSSYGIYFCFLWTVWDKKNGPFDY
jgi:hypothetical protein